MPQQTIGPVSPFLIVRSAVEAAKYYEESLGFEVRLMAPESEPFFAIVGRGAAQIFLKAVCDDIQAQPNHLRHPWAPWDAFIFTEDPAALAHDITNRGTSLHQELCDREDGLRGFEVRDADGYVLFFGKPV